ncbi:uncharacterized protein ALTATR162_LOCUS2901 [Alternaria atra]|uniref:Xylanolytic transcriptional activator regulatory domain-containing protein n=1 Tax=Alternaria atra TaxID=119953 RepID=A0A8J2I466_9PLEO|nr:uncharacterized protein ALTATR162_LOCUS2901 [Alternaria atra]CAG5152760.1 unnamed protein product [Alternaria atra]
MEAHPSADDAKLVVLRVPTSALDEVADALPASSDPVAQPAVAQTLACTPSAAQWFPLNDAIASPDPGLLQRRLSTSPPGRHVSWVDDEQLVNLYYLNFHPSHPILLPRDMYWQQGYPVYLKAVVQFIGGRFSHTASPDNLRESVARELDHSNEDTLEMVQARLLYAITMFADNSSDQGQRILDTTIELALRLGLHERDFATTHAGDLTVLEESMRRTWYELYVIDGCIAALQRKSTFKTNTVNADVLLPCDDFTYEAGMCFMPATMADFHGNVFAEEEKIFSSFCYRIEAVRLLGRVLTITGKHGVDRDLVQAVDNALAAFLYHLPRSKSEAEISNTFGDLDELMLQAHTIIQWSTILLHYPRGDLISPDLLTHDVLGANCTKLLCPCNRQHIHSVKAIEASKIISMLAALRSTTQKHTPLFVYPLALAAVVQLSIGAMHDKSSRRCLDQHADRVKLLLGVLKSMSRQWSAAGTVLLQ